MKKYLMLLLPVLYETLNVSDSSEVFMKEQQIYLIIQNIMILIKLKKYYHFLMIKNL